MLHAARDLVDEIAATGGAPAEAWACAALCLLPLLSRARAIDLTDSARGLDSGAAEVRAAAERLCAHRLIR